MQEAAKRIARHLADRDAFLIACGAVGEYVSVLSGIDLTAYLDNGTEVALVVGGPGAPMAAIGMSHLAPIAAVFTVPKTVPASRLAAALGQTVASDGRQDVLLLTEDEAGPIVWPGLLAAAVQMVDPAAAVALRANDIRGLS